MKEQVALIGLREWAKKYGVRPVWISQWTSDSNAGIAVSEAAVRKWFKGETKMRNPADVHAAISSGLKQRCQVDYEQAQAELDDLFKQEAPARCARKRIPTPNQLASEVQSKSARIQELAKELVSNAGDEQIGEYLARSSTLSRRFNSISSIRNARQKPEEFESEVRQKLRRLDPTMVDERELKDAIRRLLDYGALAGDR